MSVMISKTLVGRKFGIELEHISNVTQIHLMEIFEKNNIELETSQSAQDGTYLGWQIKGDGSISPQNRYPYGIEIASPPLTQRDYLELVKVVKLAKQYGGVNSSCGMHVHVSAPELAGVLATNYTHEWQEYVHESWLAIQPTMFSYVPMSRRNSNYCRPGINWATKYMAINFAPLRNRRTIEFRLHSATLNPVKVFAFAILCRNIVDALVHRVEFRVIKPEVIAATTPRFIRTRRGGEFYIQRDDTGKWLIEAKKLKVESDALVTIAKDHHKQLLLDNKEYLPAFRYPHYGNAFGDLCELVGVNGIFRSFMEDRYDRMVKRCGVIGHAALSQELVQDEVDFYNEPGYDSNNESDDERNEDGDSDSP